MPKPGLPHLLVALLAAPASACAPARPVPAPGGADGALVSSLQVETSPDSVRFHLQVTNVSAAPVVLSFATGQRADFWVDRDGRTIWRWSEGRMWTQAMGADTLATGATRTFSASWAPPPGLAGQPLTAHGAVASPDRRVERAASFTLP